MLPSIVLASVLACVTAGFIVFAGIKSGIQSSSNGDLKIGIVGELSDYLGIDFLEQLTGFANAADMNVEFVSCTESEAKTKLLLGELSTYLIVPDGFIESVAYGQNDVKLYYVTLDSNNSLATLLMSEIAKEGSSFISLAESSCFSIEYVLRELNDPQWWEKVDNFSVQQIMVFIGVIRLWDREVLGLGTNISLTGYYICAVLVIFILLFGFNAALFFTKRERSLYQSLAMKGMPARKMVFGEYGAYCAFLGIFLLIITFVCTVMEKTGHFLGFMEWEERGFLSYINFLGCMLLAMFMLASLQFMIFEVFDNFISQIIALFFVAFFMGFICGLFYPRSFFPEWLQSVGALLPVGVAADIVQGGFTGHINLWSMLGLLGYGVVFLTVAIRARNRKVIV